MPSLTSQTPGAQMLRLMECPHGLQRDWQGRAPQITPLPDGFAARLRAGRDLLPAPWGEQMRLRHTATPSALGAHSYEIESPHSPTPARVLSLLAASRHLAKLQGVMPKYMHLQAADGPPIALPTARYLAFTAMAEDRLQGFWRDRPPTQARPLAACKSCAWQAACRKDWQREDSLYQLGALPNRQIRQLAAAGITTLRQLAEHHGEVGGLDPQQLADLRGSAQSHRDGTISLRAPRPNQGLARLPPPHPDDLFLTQAEDGTLEVLPTDLPHQGAGADQLLQALPLPQGAHIYHFTPEALTTLKRHTSQTGLAEALLDQALREGRFLDLANLARQALVTGGPLGLAALTPLWQGADPDSAPQQLQHLRQSLIDLRPDDLPWPKPADPTPAPPEDEELAELAGLLAQSTLPPNQQQILLHLAQFHTRELKPGQWAVFDSPGRTRQELIEDPNTLGGLQALGPIEPIKRSFQRSYRFPAQESKLRALRNVTLAAPDAPPQNAKIEAFDLRQRQLTLKVGPDKSHLLSDSLDLHPDWPLKADPIPASLREVIHSLATSDAYPALRDLLGRQAPRLRGVELAQLPREDAVALMLASTQALNESLLPVQGPPGTGKTFVTAQAILALLRAGKRVAISSNSHEAIRNLIMGCHKAQEIGEDFTFAHKIGQGEDPYDPALTQIARVTSNSAGALFTAQVVGGTAYLLARPEFEQSFDYLFIDEAGQVSLANLLAMGRVARNIVLVGDPRQLPQVVQGAHPESAGKSCLEWILGDHAILPPERGIFLQCSRRMHPQICGYISDQVYEGALSAHPATAAQRVSCTGWPQAGAFWCDVAHEDMTQSCPPEVEALRHAITQLLGGTWQGQSGPPRPITPEDIIVVAPYNAQVNALRAALPAQIRIGTVDRFQGQEAPICLVSMTASQAGEGGRGIEFLLSLNRINVAVSRAKGLALVFGAPALRQTPVNTLEQMALVNALCALPSWPA